MDWVNEFHILYSARLKSIADIIEDGWMEHHMIRFLGLS